MGLRIRSASRATPLRQSTTVPNVSKTSALTSGIGSPAAPCACAGLGAKSPEPASVPMATNAVPRRMRLRRVEFIVASSCKIENRHCHYSPSCRDSGPNFFLASLRGHRLPPHPRCHRYKRHEAGRAGGTAFGPLHESQFQPSRRRQWTILLALARVLAVLLLPASPNSFAVPP